MEECTMRCRCGPASQASGGAPLNAVAALPANIDI